MPVSADTLSILMSKGLAGEDLLEVVRAIDADAISAAPAVAAHPVDAAAERRRKWDRERKAEIRSGGNSTGHSTGQSEDGSPPQVSPKSNNQTPSFPTSTSLRSDRDRARAVFVEFKLAYPKRAGSQPWAPAEKKLLALLASGVDPDAILRGTRGYAASVVGGDPKFVAQAITWLNQSRWKDEYAAPSAREGPPRARGSEDGRHAVLTELRERRDGQRNHNHCGAPELDDAVAGDVEADLHLSQSDREKPFRHYLDL